MVVAEYGSVELDTWRRQARGAVTAQVLGIEAEVCGHARETG